MQIIEQYVEILGGFDVEAALWRIEEAARNCYKSEGKNSEHDPGKRDALIRHAVKRGHTSVLEHVTVPLRVVTNRGVSHEWVRHRIGWSYSQESTRYCNYGHSEGITVIRPEWWNRDLPAIERLRSRWIVGREQDEREYLADLDDGLKPEDARGCLATDLKTEIVCTANIVALRHFFKLRCVKAAHPQIRQLALQLLAELYARIPILFEDQYNQFCKEEGT